MVSSTTVGLFFALQLMCTGLSDAYPTTPIMTTTTIGTTTECDYDTYDPYNEYAILDCHVRICNPDNTFGHGFFVQTFECCQETNGKHPFCGSAYPDDFTLPSWFHGK